MLVVLSSDFFFFWLVCSLTQESLAVPLCFCFCFYLWREGPKFKMSSSNYLPCNQGQSDTYHHYYCRFHVVSVRTNDKIETGGLLLLVFQFSNPRWSFATHHPSPITLGTCLLVSIGREKRTIHHPTHKEGSALGGRPQPTKPFTTLICKDYTNTSTIIQCTGALIGRGNKGNDIDSTSARVRNPLPLLSPHPRKNSNWLPYMINGTIIY